MKKVEIWLLVLFCVAKQEREKAKAKLRQKKHELTREGSEKIVSMFMPNTPPILSVNNLHSLATGRYFYYSGLIQEKFK